jgi:putative membrane protein
MADQLPVLDPRVFLAIERTFLAWTRTALALMGFGFVVARLGLFFAELRVTQPGAPSAAIDIPGSLLLGCGLIIAGVVVQSVATLEHRQRVRRFRSELPITPERDRFATVVALCILTGGIAAAVYLILRVAG